MESPCGNLKKEEQMPHLQYLYFGCELSSHDASAILALIERTHPFAEFRHPVTWEVQREFQEPQYNLRDLETLPATSHTSIAEQIRSRLFKAARQNPNCTLAVDASTSRTPVSELFHHLPPPVTLVSLAIRDDSEEVRVGDSIHIAKHDLLGNLQKMLDSGKLQIPAKFDRLLEPENENRAVATALALWRACQQEHEKPQPAASNASNATHRGWGKVRLF
jgi:hypothetical protein